VIRLSETLDNTQTHAQTLADTLAANFLRLQGLHRAVRDGDAQSSNSSSVVNDHDVSPATARLLLQQFAHGSGAIGGADGGNASDAASGGASAGSGDATAAAIAQCDAVAGSVENQTVVLETLVTQLGNRGIADEAAAHGVAMNETSKVDESRSDGDASGSGGDGVANGGVGRPGNDEAADASAAVTTGGLPEHANGKVAGDGRAAGDDVTPTTAAAAENAPAATTPLLLGNIVDAGGHSDEGASTTLAADGALATTTAHDGAAATTPGVAAVSPSPSATTLTADAEAATTTPAAANSDGALVKTPAVSDAVATTDVVLDARTTADAGNETAVVTTTGAADAATTIASDADNETAAVTTTGAGADATTIADQATTMATPDSAATTTASATNTTVAVNGSAVGNNATVNGTASPFPGLDVVVLFRAPPTSAGVPARLVDSTGHTRGFTLLTPPLPLGRTAGTCGSTNPASSCADGLRNCGETRVDCGGPCTPCGIVPVQALTAMSGGGRAMRGADPSSSSGSFFSGAAMGGLQPALQALAAVQGGGSSIGTNPGGVAGNTGSGVVGSSVGTLPGIAPSEQQSGGGGAEVALGQQRVAAGFNESWPMLPSAGWYFRKKNPPPPEPQRAGQPERVGIS
jgi:hypothetical protein